jgi:enhancing lycopene biosynthesis protein 2
MKKIGVLLAGCGVYDGSEIQEAVFSLLAIDLHGAEAVCFAPNKDQHHVVNHLNGKASLEQRNVLIESARIVRGKIQSLKRISVNDFDALVIPGGFGAAKNLNQWAINGPDGKIDEDVKRLLVATVNAKKPLVGLCMGPTVIAQALGEKFSPLVTVGSDQEASPYEIKEISEGMESLGAKVIMKTINEVLVDTDNKIITAPCYMMEATIGQVYKNTMMAIDELFNLLED